MEEARTPAAGGVGMRKIFHAKKEKLFQNSVYFL